MNKSDPGYVQAVINQKDYGLSFEQQDFVKENASKMPLLDLVKEVFKEDLLDETSLEYENVRKFVAKVKRDVTPVQFTEEDLTFIENNSQTMKPLELAKNIFPDRKIERLSSETQTIAKYLKAVGIGEEKSPDEYNPPKASFSLVRKINSCVPNARWDANDLTVFQRKCVESLKAYMQSARVFGFMKICIDPEMKALFEEEFVKAVHDKHDLNTEELNMFISLCMEYVNIHVQRKAKMLLEDKINSKMDGDDKLYMTWVDLLEKRENDLHKSATRAAQLAEKLSSTRSKRLETMAAVNESLSKFVEEWKSEEGRKRALIIAEANALAMAKEIDRIETEEEYIANVMGIGRDEIIRF